MTEKNYKHQRYRLFWYCGENSLWQTPRGDDGVKPHVKVSGGGMAECRLVSPSQQQNWAVLWAVPGLPTKATGQELAPAVRWKGEPCGATGDWGCKDTQERPSCPRLPAQTLHDQQATQAVRKSRPGQKEGVSNGSGGHLLPVGCPRGPRDPVLPTSNTGWAVAGASVDLGTGREALSLPAHTGGQAQHLH